MPLYHFTDERNLPSIKQRGLVSWQRLVSRRIQHWPASSEDSRRYDERRNLQDYVRLCLRKEHPMAYIAVREGRIEKYVWLEISDEVMKWRATLFSDDNAVAHRANIDNNPRTALDSSSIQAEVLVHAGVNANWITFPKVSLYRPTVVLPNIFERQPDDNNPF